MPFAEVDVRDASGSSCPAGVNGEIVVRGPNVTNGYWNNPAATDSAFSPGGWFHTGDIGHLDEDGFLFIVDRLKDMFISGGENVYPAEVESALYEHSAVAESAVVAAADERWGEVGRAFVVTAPDAPAAQTLVEELRDFLRTRLAGYKVPKYFEFVDSLPRTGSGKIQKVSLRGSVGLGAHSNPARTTFPTTDTTDITSPKDNA